MTVRNEPLVASNESHVAIFQGNVSRMEGAEKQKQRRNGVTPRSRNDGTRRRTRRRCGSRLLACCLVGTVLLANRSTAYTTTRTHPQRSGLFGQHRAFRPKQHTRQTTVFPRGNRAASVLRMVLTTPESIIEQASTQKLLDILIDESVRTTARRPIMMQFDPSSGWIWRRWKGTVFSETWISMARNICYAIVVFYIYRAFPRFHGALNGFNTLWGQLLSVTTFTLTFFVNQSYALWRKCYGYSRRLQGRLHDLDMTLAAHAARKATASPSDPSTYTSASRQLLDLVSRYVRLFNLLTYASFTRSHRPILTPRGMRRLVERGLMTPQEREILVDAEIPATQRHNCILLWITRVFIEGKRANHFEGGAGFEQQFMEKIHVIRAQYGAIGDELQGRMPLAYAHIVQVLVDCVLMMYPLMAFSSGMSPLLGILGTGLLTISYQGLFDLAKQFLDPYDNENYGRGEDPLCVDTLIAETNAGSLRWMYGFEQMPVSSQRIKDGELFDYLLPVRGYTVDELETMELEKVQKEQERKEVREREEAERLEREETERLESENQALTEEENVESEEETSHINDDEIKDQGEDSPGEENDIITTPTVSEIDAGSISSSSPKVELASAPFEMSPELSKTLNPSDIREATKVVVHKVTSLGTGIPVSLSPGKVEKESIVADSTKTGQEMTSTAANQSNEPDTPSPTTDSIDEVNLTAGTLADQSDGSQMDVESLGETVYVDNDEGTVDQTNGVEDADFLSLDFESFELFEDVPWFDEVGPDGQEVRLSQILADEEWEEENIETSTATRPAEKKSSTVPAYDQTKLDGISMLWGLEPDEDYEYPDRPSHEEDGDIDEQSFDGISQLWGQSIEGTTGESRAPARTPSLQEKDKPSKVSSGFDEDDDYFTASESLYSENGYDTEDELDLSVYDGLEWHEEANGDRLSQMLADETWSDDETTSTEPILTLEDYTKKVVEILSAAEDEMLETEAILKAAPGAEYVEIKESDGYDEQLLRSMNETRPSDFTESADDETAPEFDDTDLDALSMDGEVTANTTQANTTEMASAESEGELHMSSNKEAKEKGTPADDSGVGAEETDQIEVPDE